MTEIQHSNCSHCGEPLKYTVAEKFDILAASVEKALKKELESRKKNKLQRFFTRQ
jgi:hypothetical protein